VTPYSITYYQLIEIKCKSKEATMEVRLRYKPQLEIYNLVIQNWKNFIKLRKKIWKDKGKRN